MPDSSSSCTLSVLKTVANLGLPYEIIEIDTDLADTALFCENYGFPIEQSGNTIIVASKKEPKLFAACVILATTRLDVNKCVRNLMGVSKVSFASAEEMKELTGMEVGGVTPFSLPEEIKKEIKVIQQVRVEDLETVKNNYRIHKIEAEISSFFSGHS